MLEQAMLTSDQSLGTSYGPLVKEHNKLHIYLPGGLHSIIVLTQQPWVQFVAFLKIYFNVAEIIESAGYRKVYRGLKMLIEPI